MREFALDVNQFTRKFNTEALRAVDLPRLEPVADVAMRCIMAQIKQEDPDRELERNANLPKQPSVMTMRNGYP